MKKIKYRGCDAQSLETVGTPQVDSRRDARADGRKFLLKLKLGGQRLGR